MLSVFRQIYPLRKGKKVIHQDTEIGAFSPPPSLPHSPWPNRPIKTGGNKVIDQKTFWTNSIL